MSIEASPASGSGRASSAGLTVSPPLKNMPYAALRAPTILVFDSGLGGLSVFRELARARPDARFIYAADDAGFPYGGRDAFELLERVLTVVGALIARLSPDAVVIACGTASTLVLPALRARYAIPFVGTVPAVKPACESSVSKQVSVLATPGTVKRDYTQALIRDFAGTCRVTLVGSPHLAPLAEAAMAGEPVPDEAFAREIAPCFVDENGARTDTVVLACTHYPLVRDRLERVAPWPVRWVDPAPAIARRLGSLLGPVAFTANPAPLRLFSTGKPLDAELISRIAGVPARGGEIVPVSSAVT